jgi:hypothetical protein
MAKYLDKDGYPTKELLHTIEKWDVLKNKDPKGLIRLIEDNWQFADIGYFHFKDKGKKWKLELHTCGWSGNEDIAGALHQSNFWFCFWQKSERGGHFYFEGPNKWLVK